MNLTTDYPKSGADAGGGPSAALSPHPKGASPAPASEPFAPPQLRRNGEMLPAPILASTATVDAVFGPAPASGAGPAPVAAPAAAPPVAAPVPSDEGATAQDPDYTEEYVAAYERGCLARGRKPASDRRGQIRAFFRWLDAHGWHPASMPLHALSEYVRERYDNPGSQNTMSFSVKQALDFAREAGVSVAPLDAVKNKLPPRNRARGQQAQQDAYVMSDPAAVSRLPPPMLAEGAGFAPVAPPPLPPAYPPPPAPARRNGRAEAAPGPYAVPAPPVVPQGGRVVIRVRAPGGMPGVAPGSLIEVGKYWMDNIRLDTDVRTFIEQWIHPKYGSIARQSGSPVLTYVAERLDDRGFSAGPPIEFSFAISMDGNAHGNANGNGNGMGNGPGFPQYPQQFQHQPQQAPAPAAASDKLLELMMTQFNSLIGQITTKQTEGGGSLAAQLELMEMRRRAADLQEKIERRSNDVERRHQRRFDEDDNDSGFGGGFGMHRGQHHMLPPMPVPVSLPPPEPKSDALGDLAKILVERALPPGGQTPPPAPAPAPDLLAHPLFAKLFDLAVRPQQQNDSATVQIMQHQITSLQQRLEEATKPRPSDSFESTVEAVKKLRETAEVFGVGASSGPGFAEVLVGLAENFDKIGAGLGAMLASRASAAAAPSAPAPVAAPPPVAAPALASAARPPPPQQLSEVVELIRLMASSDDPEQIAQALQAIVIVYAQTEGYAAFAPQVVGQFAECDSRPEVRSFATRILKMSGDRSLPADEEAVERVTFALWSSYSDLYRALTGQEKTLFDAEDASEEAPEDDAPADADADAEEGAAPEGEEKQEAVVG